MFFCLEMHANEAKGSIQSRIDPFALFTCKTADNCNYSYCAGFVRVLDNLESPGILLWHFPGLESPGKRLLVLKSSGNVLNLSKKYEMYGSQ